MVWSVGIDNWHDDVEGLENDPLASVMPTAREIVETTDLDIQKFMRKVEQMVAASLSQRRSLRRAGLSPQWLGAMPKDPILRGQLVKREDDEERPRSLFHIESVGLVHEGIKP